MPFIKDTFSILAECAAIDLPDTRRVVRESEVRSDYENIEEAEICYEATAEIIPVIQIGNEYFTEAQFMAPFMRDAGIRSMAEALDIIAEANNLPAKSVGLLIESNCCVSAMIEKACDKGNKAKDAVMDKVNKATNLAKELKSKGYPVKRKMNEDTHNMKTADDFRKKKEDEKASKANDAKAAAKRFTRVEKNTDKKDFDKAARASTDAGTNPDAKSKVDAKQSINNFANGTTAKLRHDRRHGTNESVANLFDFDMI